MFTKRGTLVILVAGIVISAVGIGPWRHGVSAAPVRQTVIGTLQGRVYEGETGFEPPNSTPIQGVTVSLYCSSNYAQQGTFLRSTTTDSQGWYGLDVYDTDSCEYYNIIETAPAGYYFVGCTTVDGNCVTYNWIEYSYPLTGNTLTGNKFWNKTNRSYLPLVVKNY